MRKKLLIVLSFFILLNIQNKSFATEQKVEYFFNKKPYISPRIIQDLSTWISDGGDQVVAINLKDSQGSNRYFGDVFVNGTEGKSPFVYTEKGSESFGYRYVGVTDSGVYVLYFEDDTGGSGSFRSLMFVIFEHDKGITIDWDNSSINSTKERLLIKKLGEVALGDRWFGDLKLEGNKLYIGKDKGWFTKSGGTGGGDLSYDLKNRIIEINIKK
ncbi:MAG: hypothetical protein KAI43_13270 [Candidatus Aureabacteria bacterium]|nr:hypothetical protein [Candidatus Auribacterota bacterium]